jgi:amino acid permease
MTTTTMKMLMSSSSPHNFKTKASHKITKTENKRTRTKHHHYQPVSNDNKNNSDNTMVSNDDELSITVPTVYDDSSSDSDRSSSRSNNNRGSTRLSDGIFVDNGGDIESGARNNKKRSTIKSMEIDNDVDDQHLSKCTWLHAFYHSVVVCIGTGILGLPHAAAYLGYAGMTILLTFVTVCTFYTANLLIVCQNASRERSYTEVAKSIMGRKFAVWCVRPFQFLQFFCVLPVFIVVGAQGIQTMDTMAYGGSEENDAFGIRISTLIMGVIVMVLSFAPNLSKAWWISAFGFLAAVMIACYAIFGSASVLASGQGYKDVTTLDTTTTASSTEDEIETESDLNYLMGVFSSFGSVIFAYGYQVIMADIQASLQDHGTTDARRDMKKATAGAYGFAFPAYFFTAILGYAAFGPDVNGELLLSLNDYLPAGAMYVIWIFVIVKVATEASVFNQAAFTFLRDILGWNATSTENDEESIIPKRNIWIRDAILRIVWVTIGIIIAAFVPIFSDLSAIAASVATTPLAFVIPVILWNNKYRDTASSLHISLNRVFMVVFVLFAIIGLTGAVYDLVAMFL